jgi:surfeit locus 1 family protein
MRLLSAAGVLRVLRVSLGPWTLRASWGMTVLTLVGALLFVQAGRWQWHRAAEKRSYAAAFAAGTQHMAPLGARASSALPRYARVSARGSYDTAHQFLLDNIINAGKAGYEVLTPFRLEDGRTLLVNRGWVPLPLGRRDALPDVALVASAMAAAEPIEISGRLDALPVAALASGTVPPVGDARWPKRTSFPTALQLGATLGVPIEAQQLLLAADQPQGYLRNWQPASAGFGPERHLAYAIQWWGLGALCLFLFLFLNVKRKRS